MRRGIRSRWPAVAGLAGAILLTLPGRPAQACTCAALAPAQHLAQADAVFRGTIERLEPDGAGGRAAFFVTWVYKGSVGRNVSVSTGRTADGCGLQFRRGKEYLVYANDGPSGMSTDLCLGTTDDLFSLDRAGTTGHDVEVTRPRPAAAGASESRAGVIAGASVLLAAAFGAHARRFRAMTARPAAQPRA